MLWLPMCLPWIPIAIWLRPRLRILTFRNDNDNGRLFFLVLSGITIIATLLTSQSYLTTSTGKISRLHDINDLEYHDNSRYYQLDTFYVAQSVLGSYSDVRTGGKYNQDMNFNIYFVTPILKDTSGRMDDNPKYWYGVKFHKQISNKISIEKKEKEFKVFYNECRDKVGNYAFHDLDHFERTPTSERKQHYVKAIETRTKQKAGDNLVILEPIQERFEDKNKNKFAWIFGSFGIGLGVLMFSLIWPGCSESERKRFLTGKKPKHDDLKAMLNYLVPKGDHFATSIILDLNILIFLLMVFSGVHITSPNGSELLEWGANRRQETSGGDWWRLLASMFLHGGFMHLVLNISGLVIASFILEPLLKWRKYLILYLVSGLCGSLTSIWWYPNIISVGASGAIFGLFGAILSMFSITSSPKNDNKGLLWMIGVFVGINLLWGLTGGIDNAAHIGGLISGSIIGIVLYKSGNK